MAFRHLFIAGMLIIIVLTTGTLGYMFLEDLKLLDAVYLTVVTLSSVGYGDICPSSDKARIFTIFFIIFGVSVFCYAFSAIFGFLFEGKMMEVLKLKKINDKLARMQGHVVLCGYGDVGAEIAEELEKVVVVEQDMKRFEFIVEKGLLGVHGNSTQTEVLKVAGIEKAQSMIVALDSDPDVVFTILTAKEMNPAIKIYARANTREAVSKIRWAGADHVVCLTDLGSKELLKALNG